MAWSYHAHPKTPDAIRILDSPKTPRAIRPILDPIEPAKLHPLLARLIRRSGATVDAPPTAEQWQQLVTAVSRTYDDADLDRYTIERAIDVSSREMGGLYRELEVRTTRELAALRYSDERHRVLFDANPLPIWVIDAQTLRFLAVNDATIRTYGYTRDEFLAMTAIAVKLADEADELIRAIAAATPGAIQQHTRRHRCKDGRLLDVEITYAAIQFEGRTSVLGITVDKTRAQRMEQELRQAQKMEAIGQLAGGIAHDFNNILAVIVGSADFARRQLEPDHEVHDEIAEIQAAAGRAAGLTRQLLMFSRKQQRQPRSLALNAIVTHLEGMLSRIVGEDIYMSAVLASQLGTIVADSGEIEQVLLNLVVNARDAMPTGGKLVIETANVVVDEAHAPQAGIAPGRYVTLSVSDTGCGMTADVRARIFDPFFTTKDVDKGTGLGLSTVFGIVKQSNGGITVYSEPNLGSTFRIYLPRTDAATRAPTEPPPFTPVRASGTILVVEDDDQLRRILLRYLTSWGYDVLEARNGNVALAFARDRDVRIDVVLTDLVMPELDGRALGRALIVERPGTKIVFMSGYTEHATLRDAKFGPDELFMQKPFAAQTLYDTIERALRR